LRHITKFLALAIAALALVAAGCGGDDDEGDTGASGATGVSGTPLSHAEFVSQADAICKQGGNEIDQAGRALGDQPSQPEVEAFVTDTLVPGIQDQIDQVAALTPPEDEQDQIQEFIQTSQDDLDALEADPSLLQGKPFADANQMAEDIGLRECAS
jgi:hypothetical protein